MSCIDRIPPKILERGLAISLLMCFVASINSGCGMLRKISPRPAPEWPKSAADYAGLSEEALQQEMKRYLGIPYRPGGSGPEGTDCSGLIRQMYGDIFRLDLPHNAAAQFHLPFLTDIPEENLKAGDLLFFGANRERISHIGAYLADGSFIHASRKAGVIVSRLDHPYWRKRFAGSRRILW